MKVTQDQIEQKVVDYIMDSTRHPKFILLDKESYQTLNKSFTPIEKNGDVKLGVASVDVDENDVTLSKIHLSQVELNILPVDVEYDLFEVVG